jgi:predicted enzyme related to lactoylglutathione lyase
MTQGRAIVHVEIPAKAPREAGRFYAEMFGWGIQSVDEMNYVMFDSGNIGGGFPEADDKLSRPGDVLVYVDSDDIEADLKKIESLGGKTVRAKEEIPGFGWFAVFSDPTGNNMALYTSKKK